MPVRRTPCTYGMQQRHVARHEVCTKLVHASVVGCIPFGPFGAAAVDCAQYIGVAGAKADLSVPESVHLAEMGTPLIRFDSRAVSKQLVFLASFRLFFYTARKGATRANTLL